MKSSVSTFAFTVILDVLVVCKTYKILLVPYIAEYNSRLINMLKMADFLFEDGHDVSVLLHSRLSHSLKNPNVKPQEITIPDEMKLTSWHTLMDDGKLKVNFASDMNPGQLVKLLGNLEVLVCEKALSKKCIFI